jgi:hypothetical protein
MQGRIFADIRAGIPPAIPHLVCDSESQNVWNLLGQCWEREPSRRPSAQRLLALLRLLLDEAQSANFDVQCGSNIDASLSKDNETEQTRRETPDEDKKTPPDTMQSPTMEDFNEMETDGHPNGTGIDAGLKMNSSYKWRDSQSIPETPIASVNVESGEDHTWDPVLRTVGDMDVLMKTKNSDDTGSLMNQITRRD